jgi:hypothetical protein
VFFLKRRQKGTAAVIGAMLCTSLMLHSETGFSAASEPSAVANSDPVTAILSASSLPPNFSGDDPAHVRDALTGHVTSNVPAPSVTSRVRSFLSHPLVPFSKNDRRKTSDVQSGTQADTQANRTFVFVIPASYGVRYESKRKTVSVNVSLASPETPDAILLKQTIKGQSGRKLVVAPEAKAKGFVQTIDTIQLQTDQSGKTNVRGRMVANDLENTRNGDFAIVLVCTLVPPYMTQDVAHSEPTEEEPTDITRKTSTLQGIVNSVWLIDRKDGTIVSKRLRLVK